MYTLTKTDIAALRKADSVTFHYNARKIEGGERRSFIRAHKRVTDAERERDPFAPYDRTHEIDLGPGYEQHRMANYGPDEGPFSAFAMASSAQFDHLWRTAARSLKVGESVVMYWTRDNNNDITKDAGLHVDSLQVAIGAEGKPARRYHVSTVVSLDNSARMTQRV